MILPDEVIEAVDRRRVTRWKEGRPPMEQPIRILVAKVGLEGHDRGVKVVARALRDGGTVRAIEQGWFQQAQADFAYDVALRRASGEDVVVGVNRFVDTEPDAAQAVEMHPLDPESERRQVDRLRAVRAGRSQPLVERLLNELAEAARDPAENLMPATIAAVKAQATMGEIVGTGKPA